MTELPDLDLAIQPMTAKAFRVWILTAVVNFTLLAATTFVLVRDGIEPTTMTALWTSLAAAGVGVVAINWVTCGRR